MGHCSVKVFAAAAVAALLGSTALAQTGAGTAATAQPTVSDSPGATQAAASGNNVAAAPASDQLGEIVVTAERRATSAQRTAIAIDVLQGDTLRQSGVGNVAQLQTLAPGVTIGANATSTIVTVRGVSSRDVTEIGDPAVAINVDGLFLQRPTGMNAGYFDLSRIEVLRGPQGTLYGRNATGGVINILTQRPTQEFGGYASLTAGNFSTIAAEGALNVPLSDDVAVRASFVARRHSGYRDNYNPLAAATSTGRRTSGDDEDSKGGRLQLLAKPSDRLKVLLSATYINQGGNGPVQNGYATAAAPASPPTKWSEVRSYPLSQPGNLDVNRLNLLNQIDYDIGFATLTNIAGYIDLHVKQLYDNDGLATAFYDFSRNEKSGDFSDELRIASHNTSGFTWQAGLFYYHQKLTLRDFNFLIPNGVPVILRDFNYGVRVESKAAFGQASLDLLPGLKVSAGLRYSTDDKRRTGLRYAAASLTPPAAQVATNTVPLTLIPETDASRSSSHRLTYHAGLDYQVSNSNLLYAKIDKGYKAGGFTAINVYGPEDLVAYEIGSKNRFLNRTLQLNLSAFYYDYKNQQVSQVIPAGQPFAGSQSTLNAGKSRLKGVEAQVDWLPTPNDPINLSVNYLDAKFHRFAVAFAGSNLVLDGNRLIQSPKWVLQGGYEHAFELASGAKVTPRVQAQHRSSSYLTFFNRANDRQAPYTLVDATLTFTAPRARWSLQGFVRNIGNAVVLTNADTSGTYGAIRYQFGEPRTFGARVQANF